MDELNFEAQLKYYESIYGENDFAFIEAAETHSLVVVDRIRDYSSKFQQLLSALKSKNSQKYLAYGTMRRILMIINSYNSLRQICHYQRNEPLSPEERRDLDRDINMVYINIRGVMDNLAWGFLYEKDLQVVADLELEKYKTRVGLFSREIRQTSTQVFWKLINDTYGTWAREFAAKRDPVAHGLPMYIIPKFFVGDEQRELADKLDKKALEAVLNNNFEISEDLRLHSQKLGIFAPFFSSDPTEKLMPIYPVVSIDISQLIRILECFENEIKS